MNDLKTQINQNKQRKIDEHNEYIDLKTENQLSYLDQLKLKSDQSKKLLNNSDQINENKYLNQSVKNIN